MKDGVIGAGVNGVGRWGVGRSGERHAGRGASLPRAEHVLDTTGPLWLDAGRDDGVAREAMALWSPNLILNITGSHWGTMRESNVSRLGF